MLLSAGRKSEGSQDGAAPEKRREIFLGIGADLIILFVRN
jgi:hypothetical protein